MSDWQKRYLGWDHFPARLEKVEIDVFFTLAEAEYTAVVRHRKPPNRLGIAIQIGYMRMTGMALNSVELIPSVVLSHVADQLGQQPPQLASIRALYRRRRTLHEHQEAARAVLGLRVLTEHARRQLKVHLRKIVPSRIGMSELVREARGWLAHNRYQQVGERGLLDLAREVRGGFEAEIREQLIKAAGDGLPGRWAKELASEHAPRVSRLEWLRSGPRSKRPRGLADHLAKLRFLKEMGADRLDFGLSEAAIRALAMPLRHRKAASLKGPGGIDHLAIACFLRLRLLELNDTAVMLVLHRTTDLWRQARERAEQRQAGLWRQLRHLPYRLAVLGGDSALPDGCFREMTLELVQPFVAREGSVPTAQSGTRVALIREELASQNGPSAELLTALEEIGVEASGNSALCTALAGLKENAPRTGNPFGATWQGLIGQADRQRALGAWRAATLLLFKRALRNGQAHCPASLRHRAIEEQLIPAATWARDKGVLIRPLALPPGPERALAGLRDSLDQGLALLNQAVAKGDVRIEDDHFVIPKISPDNEDAATRVTRRQLFERIGHTQLTDVVVEADAATGFSRAALGRAPRSEAELITFYAALMALGTDLSAADLARMVPGVSGDAIGTMVRRLEHGKGLKAANAVVLEQFRRLPITSRWGEGITASSDMMSLETSRKLWAARQDPRRRTASVGTYTHVLDQWVIVHDQPILLGTRQAGAAIEGALRHTGIERLAVDTHGYTHFATGISKALGLALCVRPSGLADRKLYLPRGHTVPEALTPLCRATIAPGTINRGYDGFLRIAASLRHGSCSASWLLERFGSAAKGDPAFETGAAIGALERTIYLCDYLANEPFRRTIHALLAQGEAVHTLQRAIHNGPFGAMQGRSGEELEAISAALTLLTNLVIFWNARNIDTIVTANPGQYPQQHLARIAPIAHAHINMRGILRFNLSQYGEALLDQPTRSLQNTQKTSASVK